LAVVVSSTSIASTAAHSLDRRLSASVIVRGEILPDRSAAAMAAVVSTYVIQDDTTVVSNAHSSRTRSDPSSARSSFATADESK
jgi:hypothetical protein